MSTKIRKFHFEFQQHFNVFSFSFTKRNACSQIDYEIFILSASSCKNCLNLFLTCFCFLFFFGAFISGKHSEDPEHSIYFLFWKKKRWTFSPEVLATCKIATTINESNGTKSTHFTLHEMNSREGGIFYYVIFIINIPEVFPAFKREKKHYGWMPLSERILLLMATLYCCCC